MSQTGNSTYVKSMNGIITFDDGSGTVIEDGVISTTNISTGDITATSISTDDISTDNLTVSTLLKTDTIEATSNGDGKIVYVYSNLGSDDIINLGENCKTYIGNSCIIDNGSANFYNDALIVSSDAVFANELKGVATANNVNLYTTTTGTVSLGNTGKVKLGNTVSITGNTIASTNATDTVNILTATTGNIGIGSSGQIKVGNSVSITDKTIATSAVSDTVNLFNNISTGVINMAKFAIKKNQIRGEDNTLPVNLFDDHTGIISMCSGLRLSQNEIDCADAGTTYRLFDTLTSGALYVGAGLLTGSCNIASTLSTGTLHLGNTLGTVAGNLGSIEMGNALNSLLTAGNGVVSINKLQIGNSSSIRDFRFGTSNNTAQRATITFGTAMIATPTAIVANVISGNTTQMFSITIDQIATTGFRFTKNFLNFSGTPTVYGGAGESFMYIAICA